MTRRYTTMDVFTDRIFGGNPLAVVFDAAGLGGAQMQAIAKEFNYSETTFVFPAQEPGHTARVRIFTACTEVPFAGHPNVGTAVALARELDRSGRRPEDEFVFEELAGQVRVRLHRENRAVTGAEITAPQGLSIGSAVTAAAAAECLSLAEPDIVVAHHPPQLISVGLAFLAVELATRDALGRARPNLAAHARVLPGIGTDGVFAYFREDTHGPLHARMFAPLDATIEDPATGSAAAATFALLAGLRPLPDEDRSWRLEQGVDMGRPSVIHGRTEKRRGVVTAVHIFGRAVPVMEGYLHLPGEGE